MLYKTIKQDKRHRDESGLTWYSLKVNKTYDETEGTDFVTGNFHQSFI